MRIAFFFVFLVFATSIAQADNTEIAGLTSNPDFTAEFATAKIFQSALKNDNKQEVAQLMIYPIDRDFPLAPIQTTDEFIQNWDDFFDTENIKDLISDRPLAIGARGVQLANGLVWFRGNKVLAVNLHSSAYYKKVSDAKKRESTTLYPSVSGYKNVDINCKTSTKIIRVQEHVDGFHYFVWKKGTSLADKPELSLTGTQEFDGSQGGVHYTFRNQDYLYVIDNPSLCEEATCSITVTVSKNGKKLSSQVCN